MANRKLRLPGSLALLRALWRPVVVHRYLSTAPSPSLHVGCGGVVHSGWLNTDLHNAEADTYLDATKRFPFRDHTFERIFSEHLRIDRVRAFLNETYRVIRSGGLIRISCPDLALYARHYVDQYEAFLAKLDSDLNDARRKKPQSAWILKTHGALFISGVVKDFHRHFWMYDFETLKNCLQAANFRDVRQLSFGDSQDVAMRGIDLEERAFESLYVEARK